MSEIATQTEQLNADRSDAADSAYQRYDFGDAVDNSDGWAYDIPGDEWSRTTYVGEDDLPATFVVRFEPGTARIAEAYAITGNGNIFGHLPEEEAHAG